jgi:hypothetical protein
MGLLLSESLFDLLGLHVHREVPLGEHLDELRDPLCPRGELCCWHRDPVVSRPYGMGGLERDAVVYLARGLIVGGPLLAAIGAVGSDDGEVTRGGEPPGMRSRGG